MCSRLSLKNHATQNFTAFTSPSSIWVLNIGHRPAALYHRKRNPSFAVNAFQPGNQTALKHGGYARRLLLSDEVIEDAKALTLDDELFRLRAANLVASENIGRWISQLEDAEKDQVKILLEKIRAAENAMMRNTVRIESIEHTLVVMGKGRADTTYREVTTEKVELEVGKLKLQLGKNIPDDPGSTLTNPTTDEAADVYRKLMG